MDELRNLIDLIQDNYTLINKKWVKDKRYVRLNMKKIQVSHVYRDESILYHIFDYRDFLLENLFPFVREIKKMNLDIISNRVKALNSIQYKINNYQKNHENGRIPLKKCINDILGIRIILNDDLDYGKIKKFIKDEFPNLKCIESRKKEYYAVHIYFGNEDNENFQWELQIWNDKNVKTNLASHAKYKQDYVKWENENQKKGVLI